MSNLDLHHHHHHHMHICIDPPWSSSPYITKVRWESGRDRKWLSLLYAPPPSPITIIIKEKITKERRVANREGKRPSLLPMSQKLCALSGQTAKKGVWFMSSRSIREIRFWLIWAVLATNIDKFTPFAKVYSTAFSLSGLR